MNRHPKPRQPKVVEPPRPVDSPYLTSQECVVYLRLPSLGALYRLIREHGLPHGRLGGQHRFDKRQLDAFLVGLSEIEAFRKRA